MPNSKAAVITQPVNRARAKAQPMAQAEFDRLLRTAEASAKQLGDAYAATAGAAARQLLRLAASATSGGPDRAAEMAKLADMAFELRGEGGSFGFDIVSQVADSLYRMTADPTGQFSPQQMHIVHMHALALNSLIAGGVRSAADDPIAAQILAALAAAKAKAPARGR